MGFILSFIAYILFPFIAIANFVTVMYKNVNAYGFFRTMNTYWFRNAIEVDEYANHHFAAFWNVVLRTSTGYHFGDQKETISSALGKNQRDGTLSWFGWFLVIILYILDFKYWFKGGHALNSINEF